MARRVNLLFRNATIYESRALAELSIKNQEKVDGDIILVRYKEPGDTEITTIAGLLTSIGNQQSVTLIATQKDLDSLKNSANPLLSKHSEEITNLLEALVTEVGLTEGTESATINGQQVAVKTFSYPGMGATNYLSRTVSIIDALHLLDSSLADVEEKVDKANNTNSYDSSINISDEGQGWNFEVNIKSGEHILSSSGNEGLYTNLTLEKITTTNNSPYAAQYKLKGTDGTYLGATIDIPRDLVIKRAYLADTNNVEIISSDTTSTAKYMVFEVYTGIDSTATTTLSIDISRFFEELELSNIVGNGLEFSSNSKINVKIDSTSESYLTVSANGIKLSGIPASIVIEDSTHKFATNAEKTKWNTLSNVINVPEGPGLNTTANTIMAVGESSPGYGIERNAIYIKAPTGSTDASILKITGNGIQTAVLNGGSLSAWTDYSTNTLTPNSPLYMQQGTGSSSGITYIKLTGNMGTDISYIIESSDTSGGWDHAGDAGIPTVELVRSKVDPKYTKPSGGIPKTDLASAVQTSLGLADTALQSFTETDPVFSASAAATITSLDITNWNGKSNFSGSYNDLTNKPTIPTITFRQW